jgi:hypothetical protein
MGPALNKEMGKIKIKNNKLQGYNKPDKDQK